MAGTKALLSNIKLGPIKSIPIKQIDLDIDNPRIRGKSTRKGKSISNLSQSQLLAYILEMEEDAVKKYKQSILQNGVLEAIYVKKMGKRYIVKEGNVRVATLKDAVNQKITPPTNMSKNLYSSIKAQVYDSNLDAREIHMHLTLIQQPRSEWGRFERAQNYHLLHKTHAYPLEDLSRDLGLSKTFIKKEMDTFPDFIDYQKWHKKTQPGKLPAPTTNFSRLAERKTETLAWTKRSPKNKTDYFKLITGQNAKLTSPPDIREFNKIIANMGGKPNIQAVAKKLLKDDTYDIKTAVSEASNFIPNLSHTWIKSVKTVANGVSAACSNPQLVTQLKKSPQDKNEIKRLAQQATKLAKKL